MLNLNNVKAKELYKCSKARYNQVLQLRNIFNFGNTKEMSRDHSLIRNSIGC